MIKLAVVGDICSGKSYVAKLFGYPVFNADFEVARLYKKSRKCYKKLKKILPSYITSFPIRKKELLNAIITNHKNLKKITNVIHPEVKYSMNRFIKKNKKKKFVILDIPLLMENKINNKKDILVFIDAKKKEIDKRLKKRKDYSPKVVKQLRKLQLPIEVKKKQSDFIIKNNFRNKFIKKNVKKVLKEILLNA